MKTKLPQVRLTKEDLEKKCSHAILINYLDKQLILCSIDRGKDVPIPVSERFGYGFCEAMNSSYASYFIKIGINPKRDLTKMNTCEEKKEYNSN